MWGACFALQANLELAMGDAVADNGDLKLAQSALDDSGAPWLRRCSTCTGVLLADAIGPHTNT